MHWVHALVSENTTHIQYEWISCNMFYMLRSYSVSSGRAHRKSAAQHAPPAAWGLWWISQLNLTGLVHLCHWRAVFGPGYHIINITDIFPFSSAGEMNYSNVVIPCLVQFLSQGVGQRGWDERLSWRVTWMQRLSDLKLKLWAGCDGSEWTKREKEHCHPLFIPTCVTRETMLGPVRWVIKS